MLSSTFTLFPVIVTNKNDRFVCEIYLLKLMVLCKPGVSKPLSLTDLREIFSGQNYKHDIVYNCYTME